VQGGFNLGTEHGGDSAQESSVGEVTDPDVNTLPSLTPRELSSG
jgi:hypothetical protein